MFLWFTENEIMYKISCVIRWNHRAFFGTNAGYFPFLTIYYYLRFFRFLKALSVCRLTIEEPIGCRLHEIIATQPSIFVNNIRSLHEIWFEKRLLSPWILHNHGNTPHNWHGNHLYRKREEFFSVCTPFQYFIRFLLLWHPAIIYASETKCHLT